MKLNLILENIARRDFFDFYSLEYAYYSKNKDPEIGKNLKFMSGHILNDHLEQFANILLHRLPDMEDEEIKEIMFGYGITMDYDAYELLGVDKLSFQEKVSIIRKLVGIGRHHGFTGNTWFNLGRTFLELINTGSSIESRVLAIDKLYNLLHHGGMIVDYMDESDWLEDALHIRDNANPAQLFSLSSPRVRALIGRSSYTGMEYKPVDDIRKIYTALRRISKNRPGIDIYISDNKLIIVVDFIPLIYKNNSTPWDAIGGKVPLSFQRLVDNGDITFGQKLRGKISIEDEGDSLIIGGIDGGADGKAFVSKPINRQYLLAQDIIASAINIAKSKKLNIKRSYFYRDNKLVKQ